VSRQEREKLAAQLKTLTRSNEELGSQLQELRLTSGADRLKFTSDLEKANKEVARLRQVIDSLKADLQEKQSCESCLEYIKQMKGLEFKVADLEKERESLRQNSIRD